MVDNKQHVVLELSERIGQALLARGETVATAESCTGGLIAAALTEIAGSSAWFGWGVVSYANAAKRFWLEVSDEDLCTHGAVSAPVVTQMAEKIRLCARAEWGIAVSGVAGPGGGSEEKPVGTVWFALAAAERPTQVFCRQFSGDRASVRQQSVICALNTLLDSLNEAVN